MRRLLTEFPSMPATVLAERVGWTRSASWFRKQVAVLRPQYTPKDPAGRLNYRPSDQAQCDLWFPPVKIPVGGGQVASPPVLVMVASFSRFLTAWMLPSDHTGPAGRDLAGGGTAAIRCPTAAGLGTRPGSVAAAVSPTGWPGSPARWTRIVH